MVENILSIEKLLDKGNFWLVRAIAFYMGKCKYYNRDVNIEARDQPDNTRMWVVKMDSWVMNQDGLFEFEPLPSSRTDEFIARTRFASKEIAHYVWQLKVTEKKPLYVDP